MRFILNFIFFGVLFYAIYLMFPDTFQTLVSWANSIYQLIREIVLQVVDKFQGWRHTSAANDAAHAFFLFLS